MTSKGYCYIDEAKGRKNSDVVIVVVVVVVVEVPFVFALAVAEINSTKNKVSQKVP